VTEPEPRGESKQSNDCHIVALQTILYYTWDTILGRIKNLSTTTAIQIRDISRPI